MKVNYQGLINRVNAFNEVFLIDFNSKNTKKWADYLNPITKYLYGKTFLEFISSNEVIKCGVPGILEKYFNIFAYVEKDLKSFAMNPVAEEIYNAAFEVKQYFDRYIHLNNYKVVKSFENDYGVEKIIYSINPLM
ncbi:MAG: hypothetical protein ACRC4L_03100 [Mycoplasma sp.]